MWRRKLQVIAGTTFTISLPKEWVLENKIQKNDEVTIPYSSEMSSGEGYSVSLWAKPASDDPSGWVFSAYEDVDSNLGIRENSDNWVVWYDLNDAGDSSIDLGSIESAWQHIVVVYNQSGIFGYKNGVLGDNSSNGITGSFNNLSSPIYFVGYNGGSLNWDGSVDELIVFNRSLSLQEIKALYNSNVDQYYRNFTSLSYSDHTYKGYAVDLAGNLNETERFVLSISDVIKPNITDITPSNGTVKTESEINFTANVSDDVGLSNVTLYIYNETGLYNQTTVSVSGTEALVGLVVNMVSGVYTWFWEVMDLAGNFLLSSDVESGPGGNYTLTVDVDIPSVYFQGETPASGSSQNVDSFVVNVSSSDNFGDHYTFVDFDNDVVLWMRMDDVNGSGDPTDLSSYSNNGTLEGNAVINSSSGYWGNGSWFDGSNDNTTLPFIDLDNSDITISTWVKLDSMGSDRGIVGRWSGCTDTQFLLYADEATTDCWRVVTRDSDDNGQGTSIDAECDPLAVVQLDQWQHVAFTYKNNDRLRLYVDGVEADNDTADGPVGLNPTTCSPVIGSDADGSRDFIGSIDEVLIFNRSLSADEVGALYNATANQYFGNFTNLSEGSHTFTGHAVDKLGNRNQTEERSVTYEDISCSPPGGVDVTWEVTGTEICENQNITHDGEVDVKSGGKLVFNNVTFNMNITANYQHDFQVDSGGTFITDNETLFQNENGNYVFDVDINGAGEIINTTATTYMRVYPDNGASVNISYSSLGSVYSYGGNLIVNESIISLLGHYNDANYDTYIYNTQIGTHSYYNYVTDANVSIDGLIEPYTRDTTGNYTGNISSDKNSVVYYDNVGFSVFIYYGGGGTNTITNSQFSQLYGYGSGHTNASNINITSVFQYYSISSGEISNARITSGTRSRFTDTSFVNFTKPYSTIEDFDCDGASDNPTIAGYFEIVEPIDAWDSGCDLNRHFPFNISWQNGSIASYVNVTIYNNSEIVRSGLTDSSGIVWLNFTADNSFEYYYNYSVFVNGTFGFNMSMLIDSHPDGIEYSILQPAIGLELLYPTDSEVNVSQYEFFNVTVNVSCSNGDCGEINVSLDPIVETTLSLDSSYLDADVYGEHITGLKPQMKWDISSIPNGVTILDAKLIYYVNFSVGLDNDVNIYYINNESWEEGIGTTDWTAFTELNATSETFSSITSETWTELNVSVALKQSFDNGNENFTIRLIDPDWTNGPASIDDDDGIYFGCAACGQYMNIEDRENTFSTGNTPVLNITYSIETKGLVNDTIGATPYYTNESNPRSITLGEGESQEVVYWVNATGELSSTNTFFAFANLTSSMSTGNVTNEWNVTIISENDLPTIPFVETLSSQTPSENTTRYIEFTATVEDSDGVSDVDVVSANFSYNGITRTNESCVAISGEATATEQNYSCTIGLHYFDEPGSWNISVFANDSEDERIVNLTQTFTYNILYSFIASPNSFGFSGDQGDTNVTSSDDPIVLYNYGNANITTINVEALNLYGESDSSYYIEVGNISVGNSTGLETECDATTLVNGTNASVTNAELLRGNYSVGGGVAQEELFFCMTTIPTGIPSQDYSTSIGGSWTITIALAVFGLAGRKRKKKKEDPSLKVLIKEYGRVEEESIKISLMILIKKKIDIPVDIFNSELGALESLVSYLKEVYGFNYRTIAQLIDRNERTVWTSYNKAVEKVKKSLDIGEGEEVSLERVIKKDRTVLESVIVYLRDEGMSYSAIGKIIGRDQRNVRATYLRAVDKLKN